MGGFYLSALATDAAVSIGVRVCMWVPTFGSLGYRKVTHCSAWDVAV